MQVPLRSVLIVLAVANAGCQVRPDATSTAGLPNSAPSIAPTASARQAPEAYPRGRWRLADPLELQNVVLWVSHILIRHDHSDLQVPFTDHPWRSEPSPPKRTQQEALALAESIADRAAHEPESFADLARETSEDIVTAPAGGSLGGISAIRLLGDPGILDALATLGPGEVSRPIATRHGYDILLRRPPPQLAFLAARRILIPYEADSGRGDLAAMSSSSGRSREEAYAIAAEVAAELRADPHAFNDWLAKVPAPADGPKDGSIGLWTNQDSGDLAREREILAPLPVGGSTDPIDSPAGFQVFLRTRADIRARYAVETLQLDYDKDAPVDSPNGRAAALEEARALAKALAAEPRRFDDLRREHCCAGVHEWRQGRESEGLLASVEALPLGSIARTPVEYRSTFILPKHVDFATSAASPQFEIPAPEVADVLRVAKKYSGSTLQKLIQSVGDESAKTLALAPSEREQFKAMHEELAGAFQVGETSASRQRALELFRAETEHLLRPDQYGTYWDLLTARITTKLMTLR